jgi:hypothetical protein
MLATTFSLALGSLVWAALLAWPGELFTPARTTYRLMHDIAPEELWALAFGVQGATLLYLLLSKCRNKWVWVTDGLFGCILWTASTIACFASHFTTWETYQPPGAMSSDIALMFASWWHLVRLNVIQLIFKDTK